MIQDCESWKDTAPYQPSRKVSISSLSQKFNYVVYPGHSYLEKIHWYTVWTSWPDTLLHTLFLRLQLTVLYSLLKLPRNQNSGTMLPYKMILPSLQENFWPTWNTVTAAFVLFPLGVTVEILSNQNMSLFGASFFVWSNTDHVTISISAVKISNDLYGNDIMSSFEMKKWYTNTVVKSPPVGIPKGIVDSNNNLQAKRKLALILE